MRDLATMCTLGVVAKFHCRSHASRQVVAVLWMASVFAIPCWDVTLRAAEDVSRLTPADTSSPRATLLSFIESANRLHDGTQTAGHVDRTERTHDPDAQRMYDCLDLSGVPQFERDEFAAEVSICLKEIIDRLPFPDLEDIPGVDDLEPEDGSEKLDRWQIPGSRITIALVEDGPHRHEYLFSPGTVDRAIEYYFDIRGLPYRTTGPDVSEGFYKWYVTVPGHPGIGRLVQQLPGWLRVASWGLARWKWLGLIVTLILAVSLMGGLFLLHIKISEKFRTRRPIIYSLTILVPIIICLVPIGFRYVAFHYLTIRGTPLYVLSFAASVVAMLASVIVVFGVSSRLAEAVIASPRVNPNGLNAQLIRIISQLFSILATVVVLLEGGQYLGIPLTTLLASAGVGGLAVALAAQDTLKTLFGTIVLMADKPFRVGERIVFKKYDGVVEDIGLRSTRLRLLTGHQVTVPNDELASCDIENIGRREFIRRIADVHIPMDATDNQLRLAVACIRNILEDHEGMVPQFPPRVYFSEITRDAFKIRVMIWYHPPDYWRYMEFHERLNFEICKAFEEQGIPFSLPLRFSHAISDRDNGALEVRLLRDQDNEGVSGEVTRQ